MVYIVFCRAILLQNVWSNVRLRNKSYNIIVILLAYLSHLLIIVTHYKVLLKSFCLYTKHSRKSSSSLFYSQDGLDRQETCSRSRNLLFDTNKLEGSKESAAVSQTSVETLARLFPSTKLSVLQLVLQRCGQDLLKAIEYFASDSLGIESMSPSGGRTSAFRPPRTSQTIVNSGGGDQQSQPVTGAMLAPIYTSLSRNVYGDAGYCLLNIVPEQFAR